MWVKDVGDGMSQLGLLGPAALVHGAFERLTQMAQGVQEQGEAQAQAPSHEPEYAGAGGRRSAHGRATPRRSRRVDLLLTGAPAGHDTPDGLLAAICGSVSVTVPVTTLMGHGTTPAELDGRTPIDTGTAKALAGAASGWDRILTHPITGALLAVDRYRPGSDLKRHLRARDQRCRFPACGYAARDCDIDHHHDAARGGPTVARNLGHLCRRHHVLKHHSPWVVEVLGDGAYAWTSPTGRVYVDRPQPQKHGHLRGGARPGAL